MTTTKKTSMTKKTNTTIRPQAPLAALAIALASLAGCLGADGAADDMGGADDPLRGGTIGGGAGVVELWALNPDGTSNGCTGTVISPYALITASHCFDNALGNTVSGLVDVQVNYTANGTDWNCISRSEAPGRCSGWNTTWVRRQKNQNDVYIGHDFAIVLSTRDVNGPTWRNGFRDFRNIDITVPSAGKGLEFWGAGANANDLSDDGSMRHATFKLIDVNKQREVLFTEGGNSAGICKGDSGGPFFSQTTDWVSGIAISIDTAANCAGKGKTQYAYMITQHSIDMINEELASVHPGDIGCGTIGRPNKYRCFNPNI